MVEDILKKTEKCLLPEVHRTVFQTEIYIRCEHSCKYWYKTSMAIHSLVKTRVWMWPM